MWDVKTDTNGAIRRSDDGQLGVSILEKKIILSLAMIDFFEFFQP